MKGERVVEYTTDHGRKHWKLRVAPNLPDAPGLIIADVEIHPSQFTVAASWTEGIIDLPTQDVRDQLIRALQGESPVPSPMTRADKVRDGLCFLIGLGLVLIALRGLAWLAFH